MIDLETIEREINELENTRDTSYRLCERLSWLYTCRDHLRPTANSVMSTTVMVPKMEGSDFMRAVSGKRVEDVLKIVNEHMETIRMLYPTTYDNVVRQIGEL